MIIEYYFTRTYVFLVASIKTNLGSQRVTVKSTFRHLLALLWSIITIMREYDKIFTATNFQAGTRSCYNVVEIF